LSRDPFLKGALAVAAALFAFFPAGAFGYEFRLVPSVDAREEYNTNIFFTQDDSVDSWITTVTPGLLIGGKTERMDAGLSGDASWLWYSEDSELNTTNFDTKGWFSYRVTPEFRLSARGQYRKGTRTDRFFEVSGLVVDVLSSYQQDYAVSAEYVASEKATTTLSYRYQWLNYPDRPIWDGTIHNVDMGIAYDLSRFATETKARTNVAYARGLFEDLTVDNFYLTVGVFRAVHELWSVVVNVGGRYTHSEFDVPGGSATTNDTGVVGDASLLYSGERTDASFTFSHNIAPAYGYSGASVRTAAVLSMSRRFLHDISGTLSAGYYMNKSDSGQFSFQTIDERSARIRPGIRWKAGKYVLVEAAYEYSRVDYRTTDKDADRHLAFLQVALRYPVFE
jgi:hypothetical protein